MLHAGRQERHSTQGTQPEDDKKPVVKYIKDGENKKIAVTVRDHVLGMEIEIAPDKVILAAAMGLRKIHCPIAWGAIKGMFR